MKLVTLKCEDCGETRIGHMKSNEATAAQDECPECGSAGWRLHPDLQYLTAGK